MSAVPTVRNLPKKAGVSHERSRSGNIFFITPHTRSDNLGDEIVFNALVQSLFAFGEVRVRGSSSRDGLEPEGSPWESRWMRALALMQNRSIYRIAPPGATIRTLDHRPRKMHRWTQIARLMEDRIAGPFVVLGRSVNPGADYTDWRKYRWVGARDHASIQSLKRAACSNVTYFPDCAFLLRHVAASGESRPNIGLSFRNFIREEPDPAMFGTVLLPALSRVAEQIRAEGSKTLVGFHQVDEDAECSQQYCSVLDIPRRSGRLTVASYSEFYKDVEVVISNRLHCLLLGASRGAVPVAFTVPTHTKLISLFQTVGWDSLIFDARNPDVPGQIASLMADIEPFRELVAKTWTRQREIGQSQLRKQFGPDAS